MIIDLDLLITKDHPITELKVKIVGLDCGTGISKTKIHKCHQL